VTLEIRTSARADRQIAKALAWWSKHRDKAPGALLEELERAKTSQWSSLLARETQAAG
jgi:hypothetical protein